MQHSAVQEEEEEEEDRDQHPAMALDVGGGWGEDTHRPFLHPTAQVGHRHTEPRLPAHSSEREEEAIQRPVDFHTTHRPACSPRAQRAPPHEGHR